jgi:hypothetical protein
VNVVVIIWWLELQLHMQRVAITTTKIVCSNPELYSIQHYVIKFVSGLRQVRARGFLLVFWFHPPIKLTVTM